MNDERRPSSAAATLTYAADDSAGSGERLLTAADLGEYLGLSAATILDRWQAGDLPGYKLFGRTGPVRFRASEVERFLEACHVEARA
jgi:excisionase family DNA binding protein